MRKEFVGIVQKGSGYASHLGFPTINVPLTDDLSGIFAAQVTIEEGGAPYRAVVFADPKRNILEAHILDFSPKDGSPWGHDDLVGQEITVELFEKLRETEQFESEDKLKAAIAHDVEATRTYFNT